MKTILTLMLGAFMMQSISAQNNNLVIYSQDGLKFTVILNGIRQNAEPQTNVKVTGLNAPNYQVKVIFANELPDLDQNTYLMYGGDHTRNTEYSYAITWAKDKYKLKFKSAAPIEGSLPPDPAQTVIVYTPVNAVATGTTVGTTTGTTTVTTTTMGTTDVAGGSVGVNVNGVGVGVNVNVNGGMATSGVVTESSTTTYSSTTTTTSGGVSNVNNNTTYVLPGYNGVYGCPYPMGPADFESAKKSIASKSFDDSRLTIAKQIIGSNCLLSSQIRELMELMSFEATKLELAKFSWHHNLDRGNYYKLNDAFDFETSIEELNQYTSSH
jgi:hypothetical protein